MLFRSLRLLIAGRYLHPRNPIFGHFPTHYQPSDSGTATISWTPDQPATLEIPIIRAIALTGTCSARCSLRTSAQSSTESTPFTPWLG